MPIYRISGLTVAAEMILPGALPLDVSAFSPAAAALSTCDVTIRRRPVPEQLNAPSTRTRFWQIAGDRFLWEMPGVVRIMATGGHTLDFDPAPGSDPADALPFLLGTGIGAVLYQRGALVLHASAVEWEGRAYLFSGDSGGGKSTLAAALCSEGCRLIADDVSTIVFDDDGVLSVEPDGRCLKLLRRTVDRLGMANRMGGFVRTNIDKHYVEPPGAPIPHRVPLGAIYQLRRPTPAYPNRLDRLSPLVAAQVLMQDAYRRRLALAYAGNSRALTITAELIRRVPVFVLTRPDGLGLLPDTAAGLRAHWRELQG